MLPVYSYPYDFVSVFQEINTVSFSPSLSFPPFLFQPLSQIINPRQSRGFLNYEKERGLLNGKGIGQHIIRHCNLPGHLSNNCNRSAAIAVIKVHCCKHEGNIPQFAGNVKRGC